MKFIGIVLAILLAIGIFHAINTEPGRTSRFPSGVNEDVAEASLAKKPQCAANVAKLQQLGIIRRLEFGAGSVHVVYREDVWRSLEYLDKQRQLILVYCAHVPADGKLVVIFRGNMDNKELGSVVDGHLN